MKQAPEKSEFSNVEILQASLLLVDDEPAALKALQLALSEYPDLRFACDGAEAHRAAAERRPDLILLDAEMPNGDGLAVCTQLKADPEFADIPIIFVTGHSNGDLESVAIDAGAVDFIVKPISPIQVQARVRAQLRLRYALAQQRLQANRLELALEAGDLGAWDWSARDDRMHWHASMRAVRGQSLDKVRTLADHLTGVNEDGVSAFHQTLESLSRADSFAALEYVIFSGQDSRTISCRMTAMLNSRNQLERVVGVEEDVTESRRSTTLLRSANRQLEQFAYFASHDLQAPARQMAQFAQIAQSRMRQGDSEKLEQMLDQIQSAGGRLQDLVGSFMDLSRHRLAEAGEWKHGPMSDVVTPILSVLQPLISERNVEIHLQSMQAAYVPVNLVANIWRNLISNAIRHQSADAPAVWIGEMKTPAGLVYYVEDAGRSGTPFHSPLEAPRRRRHPDRSDLGKGLGLSICKRVLRVLGGELWCEPGDHHGVRMLFSLPSVEQLMNQSTGASIVP